MAFKKIQKYYMAGSIASDQSPQDQIRQLEKFFAVGDISAMAKVIENLHEKWDELDETTQKDISKLEAIFRSLVNLKTGNT